MLVIRFVVVIPTEGNDVGLVVEAETEAEPGLPAHGGEHHDHRHDGSGPYDRFFPHVAVSSTNRDIC
jgi:hypothetical protein